jgi:hypothetical protein
MFFAFSKNHQGCLNPYIQTVDDIAFKEIETVTNLFAPGDYEKDIPLSASYLIGYYHERAYIRSLVLKSKRNDIKLNSGTGLSGADARSRRGKRSTTAK